MALSDRPGRLGLSALVATALTWLLQATAGRLLGPADYASFMVVWGFVFLEIGMLQGLQQEVTRVTAATPPGLPGNTRGTSPVLLGALVGAVGAALCLMTSPAWAETLFAGHGLALTVPLAVGFLGFAVSNSVYGVIAGRQGWNDYALTIGTDAVLRLVVVVLVLVSGAGLAGQAWALDVAALAWVVLLFRPGVRQVVSSRVSGSLRSLSAGAAHTVVATGCSAVLVSAFPVLLQLTSHHRLGPEAGVVIAAVVVTRAPLLLPLNAFQAVLLTRFVVAPQRMNRILARLGALITVTTLVGAATAALIGPQLLRLLYGADFTITSALIASLVVAAGLVTVQTLTAAGVLSLGRTRVFAGGWVLAIVVAVAALELDLSVGTRAAVALTIGPLAGLAVNLATLARHSSGPSRNPSAGLDDHLASAE